MNGQLWNLLPTSSLPRQRTSRFAAGRHTAMTDVKPRANVTPRLHGAGRRDGQRKSEDQQQCVAPSETRSLRSRKRERPSNEMSETDDVQAALHHQDTDGGDPAVDAVLLQSHQPPLQDSTAEECNSPSSQTCTNQLQVFLPTSEEGDGCCAAALDEQLGEKENSQHNLERNQETSQGERSNVYIADVKEIPKEAPTGLPAKKKRRMGMCGLTEKEQSHFLQPQKRENRPERVEKQICNNTADLVAQEAIISSPPLPSSPSVPVGTVTEQHEEGIKLHCGGDDRAQTEVHIAVTTSDGTVCDPGCSKGKSGEAEGGIVSGPEPTGGAKSDPPAEEEFLGNQEQQELEGYTAEIMPEKPQEQVKDGDHGSEVVHQSPSITFYPNPTPNEVTRTRDAIEASLLQVNSVTKTGDVKKEELTGDAGDGDGAEAGASADTMSKGFNCDSVELCEAVVTPSGSERKDSRDPRDGPSSGPSTVNADPPQTTDTTDPFGAGNLDYVSDSQLNTIALTEEELMEGEEDLGSSDSHEDATDLICGLIRELSSLNRKVMVTKRELEKLRCGSRSSRSSIH